MSVRNSFPARDSSRREPHERKAPIAERRDGVSERCVTDMTNNLTHDEMRALTDLHGNCEVTRDFEGALATMTDAPFYEFFPYRLRVSGRDAIIEFWSRIFTASGPIRPFDMAARVPEALRRFEYLRDDSLVNVSFGAFLDEDGVQHGTSHITRFEFDGDKISSESLWIDGSYAVYFDRIFDESFRALPGVEEI